MLTLSDKVRLIKELKEAENALLQIANEIQSINATSGHILRQTAMANPSEYNSEAYRKWCHADGLKWCEAGRLSIQTGAMQLLRVINELG